ncbi:MAG: nucleotidyltransferase domain-containing protein [Chloroflexi bacterium]|nr:nucleotidyltransferase domain-containing protein [Chloroflexota bacterium]
MREVAVDQAALLREAVERLVKELRPERIYLFGSRARGDWREDSDYDVMVLVDYDVERPHRLEQQAYRALHGLRLPIEVVVMGRARFEYLSKAAASLPATVEREGRLLYAA